METTPELKTLNFQIAEAEKKVENKPIQPLFISGFFIQNI